MNIYDYIDNFGIYSFKEKEFNDVDAVIFSFLSYANLKKVMLKDKMKISEIGKITNSLYKTKDDNIVAVREGNKLLGYIKDSKRYKDCILSKFEIDESNKVQFSAISIEYEKNNVFISYEGTNELFSGWKENLLLSYEFPTKSQIKAIDYLNQNCSFSKKKIRIGGHSKGGNLALVAGMYANIFVRNKIKFIYNCDGPGLLDLQFNSLRFKNILPKYKHIIPDYSVVGLFLNNANEEVVKSHVKDLYSHNIAYWDINDTFNFTKTKLSNYSTELREEIKKWLKRYSKVDKKIFIENLFHVLDKAGVNSILELKEQNKKIIDVIYESKAMTKDTKRILEDFIRIIIKCYGNATYNDLKIKIKEMLDYKNI